MANFNKPSRVLIMAGGTGGHIFPGLAIAKALQAKGVEVFWLGTSRGLEGRLIPEAGIPFKQITISGIRHQARSALLKAPFRLVLAVFQAITLIKAIKPDLVIGMGGFVSGPGGIASWLLRKPLIIHEQNAIAGLTNRCLAKLANRVLTGFPETFPASDKVVYTGNPIRQEIESIAPSHAAYLNLATPLRLLVLGGSLGAAAINDLVPQALLQMNNLSLIEVKHQTGQAHFSLTQDSYTRLRVRAEVTPFISDMAEAYNWADIVLCRAGALTITELTAVGLPAILIPYPYAVDDHQTKNGQFLVAAGAAVMVQQGDLSAASLSNLLTSLLQDRPRLQVMAEAARGLFKETATTNIVAICEQYSDFR